MRRLRYRLWYWSRYWLGLLAAPVLRGGYWLMKKDSSSFEGIWIVDSSIRGRDRAGFNTDTVAALDLIQRVDPRRFARIQREIEFIVHSESLGSRGTYKRAERTCYIDYSRFEFSDNTEWNLWLYASTLVHEATHGAIDSRFVGYTPRLRARIERLCHTEQQRFVRLADTPERSWSDSLLGPFDETRWHASWYRTRRQKWSQGYQMIRAALRDSKK